MSRYQENSTISERILRLKPWHRSKAAKAAAAYIPTLESGGFSSFADNAVFIGMCLLYQPLVSISVTAITT